MKLRRGDLVRYVQDPDRLGIVTMTHTTLTGAKVCEVVLVCDKNHPTDVGTKRYLNQEYWTKVSPPMRPIDASVAGREEDYEEAISLYQTYGES